MLHFLKINSIGKKIIGLVLGALGLMLFIAAYNQHAEIKQAEEVTDLTEYLIPIATAVSKIEMHLVEQGMHNERALRLVREKRPEDQINAQVAEFEILTKKVDTEIQAAAKALDTSLTRVSNIQDAIALARIQPVLVQISKQHLEYHNAATKLIHAARTGQPEVQIDQSDNVVRMEDEIDTVLAKASTDILDFVERQGHLVHEHQERRAGIMEQSLVITVAAFLAGLLLAVLITRRIVAPIRQLTNSAKAVAQGDLNVHIDTKTSRDEVGSLTTAFSDMVQGLKEKESIKQTFSKYVDPRIVRHLLAPDNHDHGGDRREMTVFFSDIAGFTSVSEKLTPQSLVRLINAYLAEMSQPISQHEGVIDKFIGDAIMAYWGPPFVDKNEHASLAVRAALKSFECLDQFRKQIADITGIRTGTPDINIRIGIATGPVVIGNIGSTSFQNYTIMGDTVNLASRIEGACTEYGIRFMISESTRTQLNGEFLVREIDLIAVKGKAEPTRIFQPLAMSQDASAQQRALVEQFTTGLAAYRAQDWDEATATFDAVRQAWPDDEPSRVFLERIEVLRDTPPGTNWDGVWRMKTK
jgi:class 3 adenylate cyclase